MKKNFHHSEETKRKISEAHKGKKFSKNHIEKLRTSHLGYIMPESQRKKIGEVLKKSLKHKIAMQSIVRSKKISKTLKKIYAIKSNHPKYGTKHSKKTILKMKRMAKLRKIKFGSDAPAWQGGISFEPYTLDWTEILKKAIRERDHYICRMCNLPQGNCELCVHHIDYNKKNCNPDNLISLHRKCHGKTNVNRPYWTNYFQQKYEYFSRTIRI